MQEEQTRTGIITDGAVLMKCLVPIKDTVPITCELYISGFKNREYIINMKHFLHCYRRRISYGYVEKKTIEAVIMWIRSGQTSVEFTVEPEEFRRVFGVVPSDKEAIVVESKYRR